MKQVGNHLFYRDVNVFVDRLRDIVTYKGEDLVKANIQATLRGSAVHWFNSQLTDLEKEALRVLPLEDGWFKSLCKRFRPNPFNALNRMNSLSYGYDDVRAGRLPQSFAEDVIRYARAAEITDPFNQMSLIWIRLDPYLRRDVPQPSADMTLVQFLEQLESKTFLWQDIASSYRSSNRQRQAHGKPKPPQPAGRDYPRTQGSREQFPGPPYQNGPYADAFRPYQFPIQQPYGFPAPYGYTPQYGWRNGFPNQQAYPQANNGPNASQNTPKPGQLLLSDRPANYGRPTWGRNQSPPQSSRPPFNQNRQPWNRPAQGQTRNRAYLAGEAPSERVPGNTSASSTEPPSNVEPIPDDPHAYQATDSNEHPYEIAYDYSPFSDEAAFQEHDDPDVEPEHNHAAFAVECSPATIVATCRNCGLEFRSNNDLHKHLRSDCTSNVQCFQATVPESFTSSATVINSSRSDVGSQTGDKDSPTVGLRT